MDQMLQMVQKGQVTEMGQPCQESQEGQKGHRFIGSMSKVSARLCQDIAREKLHEGCVVV